MSEVLFQQDAYLKTCTARVVEVNERGGIVLDRTIFYATGGGQPGDTGTMVLADGREITIATTVYGEDRTQIVHVPAEGSQLPQPYRRCQAGPKTDRHFHDRTSRHR